MIRDFTRIQLRNIPGGIESKIRAVGLPNPLINIAREDHIKPKIRRRDMKTAYTAKHISASHLPKLLINPLFPSDPLGTAAIARQS